MVDPTTVRLSKYFMLSDFMGCDTGYRKGIANPFCLDRERSNHAEGSLLAQRMDSLVELLGPCSISYGFISPGMSRAAVRYQDPDKPSYHRWDKGAAADLCFHEQQDRAPVFISFDIDDEVPFSRMITYAESSWICFGTQLDETKPRRALYENRYIEEGTKPEFIKYPVNVERRYHAKSTLELSIDWRGRGWPSYHGGGRKQLHHYRVSKYVMLSDLLYNAENVHNGVRNMPPLEQAIKFAVFMDGATRLGNVVDSLYAQFGGRFSIVNGYQSKGDVSNWEMSGPSIDLIPSEGIVADDVSDFLYEQGVATQIRVRKMKSGLTRVGFYV